MSLLTETLGSISREFKTIVGIPKVEFYRFRWPSYAVPNKSYSAEVIVRNTGTIPVYITAKIQLYSTSPGKMRVIAPGVNVVVSPGETKVLRKVRLDPGRENLLVGAVIFYASGTYSGKIIVEYSPIGLGSEVTESEFEVATIPTAIFEKMKTYLKEYWYIPTAIALAIASYYVVKKVRKR